jgi:hypothetical protein
VKNHHTYLLMLRQCRVRLFYGFPLFLRANSGTVHDNRPRPLLSTTLPINYLIKESSTFGSVSSYNKVLRLMLLHNYSWAHKSAVASSCSCDQQGFVKSSTPLYP